MSSQTIGSYCQSKYLKVDDLETSPVTFTIAGVQEEEVGRDGDPKLVISFVGQPKKMVLNPTNIKALKKIHGNLSLKAFEGKQINLFETEVEYGGQTYSVIRFAKPPVPKREVPTLEAEFKAKEEDNIPY